MTLLKANKLTLQEVEPLLGLQELENGSFTINLSLEAIAETERQELLQIQTNFRPYLRGRKALEGQVQLVALAPLLRLAGFYRPPIQLRVEEDIERIYIEDEDQIITGQFDIVAVNKNRLTSTQTVFWTLVIETKRSELDPYGPPRL